jgi:hypothetical protein
MWISTSPQRQVLGYVYMRKECHTWVGTAKFTIKRQTHVLLPLGACPEFIIIMYFSNQQISEVSRNIKAFHYYYYHYYYYYYYYYYYGCIPVIFYMPIVDDMRGMGK